jgi:hypothetical protein
MNKYQPNATHKAHGKHGQSDLEAERESILERMQMSRESYRRMLHDEPEIELHSLHDTLHDGHTAGHAMPDGSHYPAHSYQVTNRFSGARGMSGGAALQWVKDHPLLCAAAVAAIVAIGPRRIVKTAMSTGGAATALTLRNPSNIDLITKVISMVADYTQRELPRRTRS